MSVLPGIRIINYNKLQEASLSLFAGTVDPDFPLTNMHTGNLHPESRITSNSSGNLIIRFELFDDFKGLMIAKHNFNSDYVCDLVANNVDTPWSGSGSYIVVCSNTNAIKENGNYVCFNDGRVTQPGRQYWFIRIQDLTANTEFRVPEIWTFTALSDIEVQVQPDFNAFQQRYGGASLQQALVNKRILSKRVSTQIKFNINWSLLNSVAEGEDIAETLFFDDLHAACRPEGTFWLMPERIDSPGYFCYYANNSKAKRHRGNSYVSLNLQADEVREPDYNARVDG